MPGLVVHILIHNVSSLGTLLGLSEEVVNRSSNNTPPSSVFARLNRAIRYISAHFAFNSPLVGMVENRAVSEGLSLLNLPDLPRTVLFTMMQEQLTKVPIDLGVRCTEQNCRQGQEEHRANRKSNSAPDGRHVHRQKSGKKVKRVSWTEKNEVYYVSTSSTPTWTTRCSSARLPSPVLKLTAATLRHDCDEKASNMLPPNPPPVLCSRLHVRRTSSGTGHRIVLAPPPESVCGKRPCRDTQPLLPASFVKTRATVLEPDKYHLPPLAASRTLTTGKVKPQ